MNINKKNYEKENALTDILGKVNLNENETRIFQEEKLEQKELFYKFSNAEFSVLKEIIEQVKTTIDDKENLEAILYIRFRSFLPGWTIANVERLVKCLLNDDENDFKLLQLQNPDQLFDITGTSDLNIKGYVPIEETIEYLRMQHGENSLIETVLSLDFVNFEIFMTKAVAGKLIFTVEQVHKDLRKIRQQLTTNLCHKIKGFKKFIGMLYFDIIVNKNISRVNAVFLHLISLMTDHDLELEKNRLLKAKIEEIIENNTLYNKKIESGRYND